MMKNLRPVVLAAAAVLLASPSFAGDLKLSMQGGRVTLIAQDVPLRQILAEWARVGRTTIVNGDKVAGPAVTLQLVDVPERQALDILLRSASGYIAAQRASMEPGTSLFDRVMILPTSRPPAQSASAPPPAFNRPMMAQPMPAEDDDEPADTPIMPPGSTPPQIGPQMGPGGMPFVPAGMQSTPGMPQPSTPGIQPGINGPGRPPAGPPPTAPGPTGTGRGGGPGSGPGAAAVQSAPPVATQPGVSVDLQPGGPPPAGFQPQGANPSEPVVITAPRPGMLPAPKPQPYVPGGPNPAGRGGTPPGGPGGRGGPGGE